MTELFSNLGQTTINQVGGIQATDTTVIVSALNGLNPGNSFPSSGNFRVLFGTDQSSEIALCTAVNSLTNTFTIIRGQEGTQPKAWPNGTAVTISVTAQAVNQMRADLFQVGPYANLPAQGLPTGSYYQTTDGLTPWIWDPSVGKWRPQINGVLGIQPPPAATFNTTVNGGNQTIVDSGKGTLTYTGNSTDASNTTIFRGVSFTPPGGVGFAETSFAYDGSQVQASTTWWETGPFFRESATGKIYLVCISVSQSGSGVYTSINIFSNPTTRTSFTGFSSTWGEPNAPLFVRVRKDNVNVYAESSRNRVVWTTLGTSTIASVFTTAPDQIGFGGFSAGGASVCKVLHYNFGPNLSPITSVLAAPPAFTPPVFSTQNGFVNTILNH